ncbi:Casparian strip membrane protein 1 [Bienertia sinuspersici]
MAPHDDEPICSFAGKSPFSLTAKLISTTIIVRIAERIVHASAKGFRIGAGLKGGLSIFSLLARLSRRRSTKSLKKVSAVSSSEEILSVITETLR